MKLKAICEPEKEVNIEITGATLLSVEEAEALPNSLRVYCRWWWLRSPGDDSILAASVHRDGSIDGFGGSVFYSGDAVRPALLISNLESSNLKIGDSIIFGNKEFEIISDSLAICKSDIGTHYFRKDWKAEDANDYEKSDVKKFIDEWFERAKNEDLG